MQRLVSPPECISPIRRNEVLLVSAIALLGAVLRFLGLGFGLPYFHHWDEGNVTDSVRDMITRGDDVPAHYYYGAPMMRLTEWAYLGAQKLHIGGFASAVLGDDVYTRLAGRLVNATIASTGTIAVYGAARLALRRPQTALVAALLYATSSDLVIHARYCVTDAALAAITAWILFLCALFANKPTLLNGVLVSLMCGIAGAYKLTGFANLVLVVPTLVLFPARGWFRVRPGEPDRALRVGHALLAAMVVPIAIYVYFRLNPHVRDHWQDALGDFDRVATNNDAGAAKPYVYRERGHPPRALGDVVPACAVLQRTPRARAWIVRCATLVGSLCGPALGETALVLVGIMQAVAIIATISRYHSSFVRYFLVHLAVRVHRRGLGYRPRAHGGDTLGRRTRAPRPRRCARRGSGGPCERVMAPAARA